MPPKSGHAKRTRGPGRPAGTAPGKARAALLAAARELSAEKGFSRVTVREVAERAGVKPALVNYYFGGKDGMLHSVIASVASDMLERVQRAVSGRGGAEERIRQIVHGFVDAVTTSPYAPRLLVEQVFFADGDVIDDFVERFARPNLAAIRSLLEDGRADGSLRDVDPRFLVPSMIGSCLFFFLALPIVRRLFDIEEIDADLAREFADHAATLIVHGIAAPGASTS